MKTNDRITMMQEIKKILCILDQKKYEILSQLYDVRAFKKDNDYLRTALGRYIEKNPEILYTNSVLLENNKEFVDEFVSYNYIPYMLSLASGEFKELSVEDMQTIWQILRCRDGLFFLPDNLKNNKEIVEDALNYSNVALAYASDELKNDKEFIKSILYYRNDDFKYASDELKNDKEFIHEFLFPSGYLDFSRLGIIPYISEELKNDKDFILRLLNESKYGISDALLSNISEKLKDDKDFIFELTKKDINIIRYASDKLKDDRDFVWQLISRRDKECNYKGDLVHYLSKRLQNDPELLALDNAIENYETLENVSDEYKNNKEFMLNVIAYNYRASRYMSKSLWDDEEVVLEVIKQNVKYLEYASERLKNDKKFMLEVVKRFENTLGYASDELKNDKEVVLAAIILDSRAYNDASNELKNDKEVALAVVKQRLYYEILHSPYSHNSKEDRIEWSMTYIVKDLRQDRDFMKQVLYFDEQLEQGILDEQIKKHLLTKIEQSLIDGWSLEDALSSIHASENLRQDRDFMKQVLYLNEQIRQDNTELDEQAKHHL